MEAMVEGQCDYKKLTSLPNMDESC